MLEPASLPGYLIGRALIGEWEAVDARLKIVDASSRNRNYMVRREPGPSYLLKQGVDPVTAESIANEARVYRALEASSDFRRRFCPKVVDFDDAEHVLALELFPEARTAYEHYVRCGRFSRRIARSLGTALGLLHTLPGPHRSVGDGGEPGSNSPAWPWVFSLHRPDVPLMCEVSRANLDLIRILQNDATFSDRIDSLIDSWTTEALIHSDVRWENCLVAVSGGRRELKLVDWELAGPGDPCWDIGSVFGAYLGFWLQFMPVTASSAPESIPGGARYPLAAMRPAVGAFWAAYSETCRLKPLAARARLLRSIGFGAVRLVQSAFERMQDAGELSGAAVCSLQLSRNMLVRPEAAAGLLGLAV